MKRLFHLFAVCSLVSCGSVNKIARSDNTRVEVRTVTEFVPDTVYITLPAEIQEVRTIDTVSVLENKYAKSEASVSDGVLAHSLRMKPVKEPVEVKKEIVYRDSLVYVDLVATETVEVAKPLTGWQRVRMRLGGVMIVLIVIAMLYLLFKFSNFLTIKGL